MTTALAYRQPTRPELEASLEAYFRRQVRTVLGGRPYKIAPTEKGLPDRMVLLPGGRVCLVELKTEAGRLSPKQKLLHAQAAELGVLVAVVVGRAGIDDWVRERAADGEDNAEGLDPASRTPEYRRGYAAGRRAQQRAKKAQRS